MRYSVSGLMSPEGAFVVENSERFRHEEFEVSVSGAKLTVSHAPPAPRPSDAQLDPQVLKAFFSGLDSPWFVLMDGKRPYWIRVTGTNLDAFEGIVKRWDAQGTR